MKTIKLISILTILFFPISGMAGDPIKSAESAGPPDLATKATIMDWNDKVLRKGSNGWTCLPDRPDTPGNDPWCVNQSWMNFLKAYKSKTQPSYTTVGVAYMLQGDTPVSNSDPYAAHKTNDADWVMNLGPHLMVLLPHLEDMGDVPTEWRKGGIWIMWKGTPYQHLMIPLESMSK